MDGIYSFDGTSVKATLYIIAFVLAVVMSFWFVPFVLRRAARREKQALPSFNYSQRMLADAVESLPDKINAPIKKVIYVSGGFAICWVVGLLVVILVANPFIVKRVVVQPGLKSSLNTELAVGAPENMIVNNSRSRLVYCELEYSQSANHAINAQYIDAGAGLEVDNIPEYICYDAGQIADYCRWHAPADPLYVLMTPAIYDKMPMPVR